VSLVQQGNGTWTITDQESKETYTFDSAGLLVSELHGTETTPSPVTFSTENQGIVQQLVTTSAGLSPANSVEIGNGGFTRASSITQVPGDGSANRVTTLAYNSSDQLSGVTDAAGETTSYSYDSNGNLSEITTQAGRHLWFFYDSNHRVIQVDAYSGTGGTYSITTYSYSGAPGQLGNTVDTDPDGNTTTYSYNQSPLPLLVSGTKDAAGFTTSTSLTADSQASSFTNQAGAVSTDTYNANMGPHGFVSLGATQDPSGATAGAAYSSTSCASGVTAKYLPSTITNNVGQLSSLCYDTAGDLTSATDPAGDTATVAYNLNGTPATSTTPLQAAAGTYTGYSWDPANQLTLARPSNLVGPQTATVYDNFGYVSSTANLVSLRATSVARDAMGRVTASTSTGSGGNVSITYHYDADGYLTSEVDPGGTTTFTYNGIGNQVAETAPGGVNDTYSYDLAS
ncbi:MAG: hypothetical protein ACRDYC_12290, partial [Acidimicrobiales bacterium]